VHRRPTSSFSDAACGSGQANLKIAIAQTEILHRLAEAELRLLLRRPASSWETFILFFYLVLEVATSIRYPRMNVPRALFLRLGSRVRRGLRTNATRRGGLEMLFRRRLVRD
jgi:hypothetical protein